MKISQELFVHRAGRMNTIISRDRLCTIYNYCEKTEGEIWECGVYRGGSAAALSMFNRTTRLFDTFEGLPKPCEYDNFHKEGTFKDVNDTDIINLGVADNVHIYKGLIPDTFKTLKDCKIGFAHIDVDLYQSTLDCCQFIVPRLATGGVILFDDYGFKECKGVKKAVDEFFGSSIKKLDTKQAVYEV